MDSKNTRFEKSPMFSGVIEKEKKTLTVHSKLELHTNNPFIQKTLFYVLTSNCTLLGTIQSVFHSCFNLLVVLKLKK